MSWAVAAALGLHPVCQAAHAVPAQMVVDVHAGEARQAIGKFTAQAVGFAAVQQQGAAGVKGRCLRLVRTVPGKGKNFRYWGRPVLL